MRPRDIYAEPRASANGAFGRHERQDSAGMPGRAFTSQKI